MCGVYKITNKINGKCYIGSTKQEFRFRWHGHKTKLRANKHDNPHLQAAWNLYGEDAFEFLIVERTLPEERIRKEQLHLDEGFRTNGLLYNIYTVAGSGKESKRTDSQKQLLKQKAYEQFQDKEKREKHLKAVQTSNQRLHDIVLVDPSGQEHGPIVNLYGFCREHQLNIRHIYDMIGGKRGRYSEKKWKLK